MQASGLTLIILSCLFKTIFAEGTLFGSVLLPAPWTAVFFFPLGIPLAPLLIDLVPMPFQKALLPNPVGFSLVFC